MTAIHPPHTPETPARSADVVVPQRPRRWGRALSTPQRIVVGLATLPLVGIVLTTMAGAVGFIEMEQLVDVALSLGEEPGMVVFIAMLACSPVQWFTKRTQVPVRKALGIVFGGYAVANFAMFVVERGLLESVSEPFLVAGTLALVLSIPLVATSSRWAQRKMGMKRWRALHKLTYVIALALVLHVALLGEIGITGVLVAVTLLTRIPPVSTAIQRMGNRRRQRTTNPFAAAGADDRL